MIIPIHPGCGGIIGLALDGLCSECGKHPDRIFQFEDPTMPCDTCNRDYTRGHHPACKRAERRMRRTGECCWMQSITEWDGRYPPLVAGFSRLERER